MSNFVKIKKDDKYFILNTESVESVFPDASGSIIKLLNGDPICTFAEIDDIAAALIPAVKSGTVIDAVSIYPPQESVKPESAVGDKQDANGVMLNTEETIFRRRYYHNGAHAGFILYAKESDFGDEMKKDIARKIEELGGKVEFKNIFINTSVPDNKLQESARPETARKEMQIPSDSDAMGIGFIIEKVIGELKYQYINDDIVNLVTKIQYIVYSSFYYRNEQEVLPAGDTLEKFIRREIGHWTSSRVRD
ncbi:TPA: hypothetical protein SJ143_000801 [Yersinia enterocolitica]|nr:hypothetical protein [Yersinia enterocolitica]